jgi:hypothetical protein
MASPAENALQRHLRKVAEEELEKEKKRKELLEMIEERKVSKEALGEIEDARMKMVDLLEYGERPMGPKARLDWQGKVNEACREYAEKRILLLPKREREKLLKELETKKKTDEMWKDIIAQMIGINRKELERKSGS